MQASAWQGQACSRLSSRVSRQVLQTPSAYSNNRGPEPSTSFAPDAGRNGYRTRPAERYSGQPGAPEQYPPPQAPLAAQPADTGTLQRSDVADKEVISTVTGAQLGVLSDLLVDAETMTVAALCMRQKTFSRKGIAGSCLELAAMVQVGDVVLVNQDAPWPQSYAQTFEKLLGSQVYTYNGIPLGKVRNFSFNPDTGSVTAVQYDELGFPSIPESWVMLWEADVRAVHDLRDGRLTLKPRAQPLLLRNGAVGRFVSGALSVVGVREGGNAEEQQADQRYLEWCRRHGSTFRLHYGRDPPDTREEYEAYSLGYEAATGTRAPLQLPAPQNRSTRDAFVADQAFSGRSMEAVPSMARRDPRTRRQVYEAPARQSPYPAGQTQGPRAPPNTPGRQDAYPPQGPPSRPPPGSPSRLGRFDPQQGQLQPAQTPFQTRQAQYEPRQAAMSAELRQGQYEPRQTAEPRQRSQSGEFGQGQGLPDRGPQGQYEDRKYANGQSSTGSQASRRQQQGPYASEAPSRGPPDVRQEPGLEQGSWPERREDSSPQQRSPVAEAGSSSGQGSTSASIPIIDTSPRPHQRRDADGNFGDPPPAQQDASGPAYREWVVDDEKQGWGRRGTGETEAAGLQSKTS